MSVSLQPTPPSYAGFKRKPDEDLVQSNNTKKAKSTPLTIPLTERQKKMEQIARLTIIRNSLQYSAPDGPILGYLANRQKELQTSINEILLRRQACMREETPTSPVGLPAKLQEPSKKINVEKQAIETLPIQPKTVGAVSKTAEGPVTPKHDVLWLDSLAEMQSRLNNSRPESFEQRIQALEKLFRQEDPSSPSTLWVTVKPNEDPKKAVHIKFTLSKGPYSSKAIDESALPHSEEHYHIKAFECVGNNDDEEEDESSPVLYIRACKEHAEIVWIGKGQKLSGNDVVPMCTLLRDHLNVDTYLYDDAKIYLPQDPKKAGKDQHSTKKNPAVWLKTSAIGDEEGLTWYQKKLDLEVAACHRWKMTQEPQEADKKQAKEAYIDQSPQKYKRALHNLRAFKVADLYKFYPIYKGAAKNLTNLINNAYGVTFKNKPGEKAKIAAASKNQHTLQEVEALFTAKVKSVITPEDRYTAAKKQYELHKLLFSPVKLEKSMKANEANYWKDVREVSDTRVFVWYHK